MKVQWILERLMSGLTERTQEVLFLPVPPQIKKEEKVKVHWRGTASNRLKTAVTPTVIESLPLQIYRLEGAHNSSLPWPRPLRFPALAEGGTDRAWCTTVSIVAEMESWFENSRGSGVKLGLRLCLPGRSSHLSRTGIPRVLPSPLLPANMSKPRLSARSFSLLSVGSGSSMGCFLGRPGRLLITLFPVLACRCRRLARRIFCTCSKFKECILLTSFWICSTSRRLYLRLPGTPVSEGLESNCPSSCRAVLNDSRPWSPNSVSLIFLPLPPQSSSCDPTIRLDTDSDRWDWLL